MGGPRRLAARRQYGGVSLCGLRYVDERGALVSWTPESAGARTNTAGLEEALP